MGEVGFGPIWGWTIIASAAVYVGLARFRIPVSAAAVTAALAALLTKTVLLEIT